MSVPSRFFRNTKITPGVMTDEQIYAAMMEFNRTLAKAASDVLNANIGSAGMEDPQAKGVAEAQAAQACSLSNVMTEALNIAYHTWRNAVAIASTPPTPVSLTWGTTHHEFAGSIPYESINVDVTGQSWVVDEDTTPVMLYTNAYGNTSDVLGNTFRVESHTFVPGDGFTISLTSNLSGGLTGADEFDVFWLALI